MAVAQALQQERKRLPAQSVFPCRCCRADVSDHIVLPCLHLCLCEGCATQHRSPKGEVQCPVCRETGVCKPVRLGEDLAEEPNEKEKKSEIGRQ